jgi:hypothetical protein
LNRNRLGKSFLPCHLAGGRKEGEGGREGGMKDKKV